MFAIFPESATNASKLSLSQLLQLELTKIDHNEEVVIRPGSQPGLMFWDIYRSRILSAGGWLESKQVITRLMSVKKGAMYAWCTFRLGLQAKTTNILPDTGLNAGAHDLKAK